MLGISVNDDDETTTWKHKDQRQTGYATNMEIFFDLCLPTYMGC